MKKLLIIFVLVTSLLINLAEGAHALQIGSNYSTYIAVNTVYLKTTFVNQNPYPAEPGGYVDLLFKIENWGTEKAENVVFELLPKYPFSLDPDVNATRELGTIRGLETDERAYLLKYKVKVDKDAIDGENEINVRYTYGDGAAQSIMTFNVTISNPRTDFDVVVQDSTATSTTLAIANIGSNTAYSAIVRIPEQENFRVTGTSANIMGNLNSGDYTLVSFQITATRTTNISTGGGKNLVVEISYTDTLGIRRTIQKEVRLDIVGTVGGTTRTQTTQGSLLQTSVSSGLIYIVIGIAGIVGVVVFLKFRKKIKRKKE
jgi:hypothetical protein